MLLSSKIHTFILNGNLSKIVPNNWNKFNSEEREIHRRCGPSTILSWRNGRHLFEIFALEAVYDKLSETSAASNKTNKQTPHLQEIVARSLFHNSSKHAIHEQGSSEMSSYLLPHPELWRDSFDSYKQYLLAKDEAIPVFDGANGIDETFKEIFNISTYNLSCAILPIEQVYEYSKSSTTTRITNLTLSSVENLTTMLHLYHGIHCVVSGKNPNYFSEVD